MTEAANPLAGLALVNAAVTSPGAVLGDLMGALVTAVGAVPSFASATRADLSGVFAALSAAQAAVTGCIAAAEVDLGSTDAPGGVDPGVAAPQLVPLLLAQTSAAAQASSLQDMASYLGRIQTNLNALGASGARVIVAGGDLYGVAADAYGDATAWVDIARVNGLTDPEIDGIQTILIPPIPSKADGVLAEVLDASPGEIDVALPTDFGSFGILDFSDPDELVLQGAL
jgi:hypothetical protein